ncbi:MAG: VWA protein [Gammaproteobacteria bacterium]|nr:VWA protein [Gammaproteobacteria bacterium]
MFRRGYLVVLLLFLLPLPKPAQAMDWESLWSRPDQRAQRAFDGGDTATAAQLFQDPAWKGSAQYKSGDFEGAVKSLESLQDKESLYNRGNALARQGNYQEAISLYDQVLKQEPDHTDAKFNKELVEKELQQQQQQKQQQQNGQNQQEQQQNQQQNQEQEQNPDQQQQPADADDQQSESESQTEQEQQQAQQENEKQPADEQAEGENQQPQMAQSDQKPLDEDQQATEQWLRRIPDDPAGLLRRKFLYQYQQRDTDSQSTDKTW